MLCGVYDTDSLAEEFGTKEYVSIIEVINMQRCSGKANNLMYKYTAQQKLSTDFI